MTIALAFSQVSKRFILQHELAQSFQERFVSFFRPRPTAELFWALREVDFAVKDGETFGILGRNGAGKSTLLKLATGILKPTSGQIDRQRRTYAMLELGAGFHPELSGRDNVFLNGSIHGLNRAEMRARFDQIVDFAELEQFIDTPVKHYSSGMFMRLGFATAMHMRPELLVIDEILAVGDAAFRRKCTEALWGLRRRGVTILFVSHNEEAVYQFCDQALLLSHGQVAALGPTDDVVTAYARLLESEADASDEQAGGPHLKVHAAAVLDTRGVETLTLTPDEPWAVELVLSTPHGAARLTGEVVLQTDMGSQVIAAPLDLAISNDGAGLRHVRADFAPVPLRAGRLRLTTRLTWAGPDGAVLMDEYESPQSVVIGQQPHGPLLRVAHSWRDRGAGPSLAAPAAGAAEPIPPSAPVACGYFAEGYTGSDFETQIGLVNPAAEPVRVALAFQYGPTSAGPAGLNVEVAPHGTTRLDLGRLVGRGKEIAVALTADRPVLAERLVGFTAYPAIAGVAYNQPHRSSLRGLRGGHVVGAVATPAETWYFAEGYTGTGFEVYLAIQNPTPAPARVTIEYVPTDGPPIPRTVEVAAQGRLTVAAHDADDPGGLGPGRAFSLQVRTTPGQPVVVERMTYFRYASRGGVAIDGATASPGVRAPARRWLFAAGSTVAGIDTYVSLFNPGQGAADLLFTYLVEGHDAPIERRLTLPGRSRATVPVHDEPSAANPAGLGRGLTLGLDLTATAPIVAERPVYAVYAVFPDAAGAGPATGGLCAPGAISGTLTGGLRLFAPAWADRPLDDHLAILNPDDLPARLALADLTPGGPAEPRVIAVPARSRITVPLGIVPLAGDQATTPPRPALLATVIEAGPTGLVVERAWVGRGEHGLTSGAVSAGLSLDPEQVTAHRPRLAARATVRHT